MGLRLSSLTLCFVKGPIGAVFGQDLFVERVIPDSDDLHLSGLDFGADY